MAGRRPVFLDGTNAGLLAAIVAVPLLAMVVSVGPIRGFVQRALEAQERQSTEISRLAEKKRSLSPIALSERERIDAALIRLEADVTPLGKEPGPQLVRELSELIEASGARDVRVRVPPPEADQEPLPVITVAALDGSRALALTPNPVHVAMRADFEGLRATLEELAGPGHTIQIDSANFVREGDSIKAELEVTYWSRESSP